MSAYRCFDEIEYLEIPVLVMKGKLRVISMIGAPKELWEEIQPIIRNPVITIHEMTEDLKLEVKGKAFSAAFRKVLSFDYISGGIRQRKGHRSVIQVWLRNTRKFYESIQPVPRSDSYEDIPRFWGEFRKKILWQ